MDSTQIGYFALCMLGGFFVLAVPWSGILLLNFRREKKADK